MPRYGFIVPTLAIAVAAAAFFLFRFDQDVRLTDEIGQAGVIAEPAATPAVPAETQTQTPTSSAPVPPPAPADLPPQPQLQDPPVAVRGIYVTGWVAGTQSRMKDILDLIEERDINAVVIDIKDYSGYVSYKMDVPEVRAAGADQEPRVLYPNKLIKELHDRNVYVIGRISVFQDSILAKAHPEWALQVANGKLWTDRKGLAWMDASARPVWDYNLAIAKDALARGFDEINFDYIRFPSDGNLDSIVYPFWNSSTTSRRTVMRDFFRYVRQELGSAKTSADLFGLTAVATDDMGIGQVLEDAAGSFDYISPMVYPSHYAAGFEGYKNPAQYPYEVVQHSLAVAEERLLAIPAGEGAVRSRLRPWLQAFDLGAVYDSAMIDAQIRAVTDVLKDPDRYAGWFLWDPNNRYRHYRN